MPSMAAKNVYINHSKLVKLEVISKILIRYLVSKEKPEVVITIYGN